MGQNFSASTQKYLEERGWSVKQTASPETEAEGLSIKLEITNAFSSGNAFIGHRKSVSVVASLFKDGKLIDSYSTSRNSSGGAFGGFKRACAVLYRCSNTLGSDVAKWMASQILN